MNTIVTLCLICIVVFSQCASGAMPGRFLGIDDLANQADAIVIATIVTVKDEGWVMSPGRGEFTIQINKILAGKEPPDRFDVLLTYDELDIPTKNFPHLKPTYPFRPGYRYILFLTTKGNYAPRWSNLNILGSHIQIAPQGKYDAIEGLSIKEAVRVLRQQYSKYMEEELKRISEQTHILLNEQKYP